MSVNFAVVSADAAKAERIQFEDVKLAHVLGDSEDALALQIDEIIRAVSISVQGSITSESDLTVELTGSIKLKAQGGVKWVFFNVGGGTETSDALKVVLKTKIKPTVAPG